MDLGNRKVCLADVVISRHNVTDVCMQVCACSQYLCSVFELVLRQFRV